MQKERVLMISSSSDTTEPASAAATESDEERHARYRRERHTELMAALEELTDLAADAGPNAGLAADFLRLEISASVCDGTIPERIARLHSIARTLDVEIEEHPSESSLQFWARKRYESGVDYHAHVIVYGDDIAEAKAALAALKSAERITVDYRLSHGGLQIRKLVTRELELLGVDVTDGDDNGLVDAVVTQVDETVRVERSDSSYTLPRVGECVSIKAYAQAIAMWVKGTPVEDIPCPASPTQAVRAMRHDGAVLTAHTAPCCYSRHITALVESGFAVVDLDDKVASVARDVAPANIACGFRFDLAGGAR
jgi:hypothetical protein